MAMNGVSGDPSGGAGTAAMKQLTYAEKQFRHTKLVRFLDANDTSSMTMRQIAEAVGISDQAVRNELRARNGGQPLRRGRKPRPVHRRFRERLNPGEAQKVLQDWLEDNPGVHTLTDMEIGTGLPKSTVRNAVIVMGVAHQPASKGAPAIIAKYERERAAMVAAVAAEEEAGELDAEALQALVDMDYVSKITDGSLVAIDRATGLLWVMKPDHLL